MLSGVEYGHHGQHKRRYVERNSTLAPLTLEGQSERVSEQDVVHVPLRPTQKYAWINYIVFIYTTILGFFFVCVCVFAGGNGERGTEEE